MIVPERMASIEDAQAQFQALLSAPPHEVSALLPALTRSRPHLRSADGRLLVPLSARSHDPVMLRWLYVDDALITDRLGSAAASFPPTFAPEWKFSIESRRCLVGTIDRRTGEFLDFARVSPWYAERILRPGALFFEGGSFPTQTLARFREVVSDAVWSWRDVVLPLPGEDGLATEVRLGTPAQTEFWPAAQYAGTERATTMRAAPRVQHEGGADTPGVDVRRRRRLRAGGTDGARRPARFRGRGARDDRPRNRPDARLRADARRLGRRVERSARDLPLPGRRDRLRPRRASTRAR